MKKRQMTKIFRAGAAVLLAGALCGCSVKFGTKKEPKPGAVVAHATNGENCGDMKITYERFKKEYWFVLLNSEIYDDTNLDEYLDAQCKAQREEEIQYLINEQVLMQKAKDLGVYELTAEEQAEVDKEYEDTVAELVSKWGKKAAAELAASETSGESSEESSSESAPAVSDEEKERLGKEKLDEILEGCGMTYDDLKWWAQSSKIADKVFDAITGDISQTELDEGYKKLVEEAKSMYKGNMYYFFQLGYSEVWLPDDARLIKHVLLGFDDDKRQEIYSLRVDGKDEEADKLREEEAAKLEEKRQEVEQKLDEGASIDDLIAEYSADKAAADAYPDGYMVVPGDTRWVSEFTEGAFVPQSIGDRTVVVTDYGVHIMMYMGKAKTSDDDKPKYEKIVLTNLKNEKYTSIVNGWLEEYAYEIDYNALRIDDPNAEASPES